MRLIRFVLFLLLSGSIFFVIESCGDCSGCDDIFTTQGAAFLIPDTSIDLSRPYEIAEIHIERVVTRREGTRNCRYKDLVSCMEDGLDSNKLEIFCTSDLALADGTVIAGTNLLKEHRLLNPSTAPGIEVPIIVLAAGPSFPAGTYTFLLKGTTREGKKVEDIARIHWN